MREVGGWNETKPQVDATHLGTIGTRAYVPADLGELETFTLTQLFDSEATELSDAAAEVIYTLKQQDGETAPANYTGQGYLASIGHPAAVTNEINQRELQIQWLGKPVFTPATTV